MMVGDWSLSMPEYWLDVPLERMLEFLTARGWTASTESVALMEKNDRAVEVDAKRWEWVAVRQCAIRTVANVENLAEMELLFLLRGWSIQERRG